MSKRQRAEKRCGRCGAPILWARNNGNALPLDAEPGEPTIGGFVLMESDMTVFRVDASTIETAIERGDQLYTNHLIKCSKQKAA